MEASAVHDRVVNVNVGVLGHVDSGKTTLVKALSTLLSTAALDKHPQSQQRGITLDLGFSAFLLQPEAGDGIEGHDVIQITLVDCPGHASLIRTIIGGAQIIDMMLLVVDATKGMQTQTAECIVVGEITTDKMIIVMNKVDLIPEEEREATLQRNIAVFRRQLSKSKFASAPIVCLSAAVGGEKVAAVTSKAPSAPVPTMGMDDLLRMIRQTIRVPERNVDGPFQFAIDHCFPIRGVGTVLTGTVLNGSVRVGDTIELPALQLQRKVKGMQMFRKNIKYAQQGDRVAISVTNLDPNLIERSIAATPSSVPMLSNVLCLVKKVRYFHLPCESNKKFHVTIGHSTVLATAKFFGLAELADQLRSSSSSPSSGTDHDGPHRLLGASYQRGFPQLEFDWNGDYSPQAELQLQDEEGHEVCQWALLQLQTAVYSPLGSLIIGSRLDTDIHAKACRLAFYGPVVESLSVDAVKQIKLYEWREKQAEVLRLTHVKDGKCFELIGTQLAHTAADVSRFLGLKIETVHGGVGEIFAPFGSAGKFRVRFPHGTPVVEPKSKLVLRFKRYLNDPTKRMVQDADYGGFVAMSDPTQVELNLDGQAAIADDDVLGESQVDLAAVDSAQPQTESILQPAAASAATVAELEMETVSERKMEEPPTTSVVERQGVVESVKPPTGGEVVAIVKGAFTMEEDIRRYAGTPVVSQAGCQGELVGPFGKMGKCKVKFGGDAVVAVDEVVLLKVPAELLPSR